jgi:hypothetical protein
MNICVQVLCTLIFISLESISRSDNFMFNLLKNCWTVLQSSHTIPSQQQYWRLSIFTISMSCGNIHTKKIYRNKKQTSSSLGLEDLGETRIDC